MDRKNIIFVAAIVVIAGLILLIVGLNYDIPSKKFYFSSIEEYVGGDAYNAMIEASLRGGEIAAAKTSKTMYICGGIITMAIGILIEVSGTAKKEENTENKKTEL